MRNRSRSAVLVCAFVASVAAHGQGIRDRTRPTSVPDTAISESQASELTLTLVQAARTQLQTWVRTAGTLDESETTLSSCVTGPHAELVRPGQRVRAFPPDSKSSISQARVTLAEPRDGCVYVEARLSGRLYAQAPRYIMEIQVDRGEFLAIPKEAIIEEGDKRIVYLQMHPGHYMPQEIHTGLEGELYTQVMHGLSEGDQVVTFGSFFIDAEHKLKASAEGGMSMGNAHQHH